MNLLVASILTVPFYITSHFTEYDKKMKLYETTGRSEMVLTRISICCTNDSGPPICMKPDSDHEIAFIERSSIEGTPYAVESLLWQAYKYCNRPS